MLLFNSHWKRSAKPRRRQVEARIRERWYDVHSVISHDTTTTNKEFKSVFDQHLIGPAQTESRWEKRLLILLERHRSKRERNQTWYLRHYSELDRGSRRGLSLHFRCNSQGAALVDITRDLRERLQPFHAWASRVFENWLKLDPPSRKSTVDIDSLATAK